MTEQLQLSRDKNHIERIRQKTQNAEGLGPFWRGILLAALNSIDAERRLADTYGVALMMIREGCADPRGLAAEALGKHSPPEISADPAPSVSEERG
jgi:hypothetical protein